MKKIDPSRIRNDSGSRESQTLGDLEEKKEDGKQKILDFCRANSVFRLERHACIAIVNEWKSRMNGGVWKREQVRRRIVKEHTPWNC